MDEPVKTPVKRRLTDTNTDTTRLQHRSTVASLCGRLERQISNKAPLTSAHWFHQTASPPAAPKSVFNLLFTYDLSGILCACVAGQLGNAEGRKGLFAHVPAQMRTAPATIVLDMTLCMKELRWWTRGRGGFKGRGWRWEEKGRGGRRSIVMKITPKHQSPFKVYFLG